MKIIPTLIKNEYIKMFRKKSVVILLIILASITFLAAVVDQTDFSDDYYNNSNTIEREIQWRQNTIESEKDLAEKSENDIYSKINIELYKNQVEILEKALEYGLTSSEDWRYGYFNEILQNSADIYYYNQVTENGEYAEHIENSFFNNDITYYKNLVKNTENLWQKIKENDYKAFLQTPYNQEKEQLEKYKTDLEKVRSENAEDTDKKNIDHEIFKLEGIVDCSEDILKAYEFMLNNDYAYDSDEAITVSKTINSLLNVRNLYFGFASEDEFNNPNQKPNIPNTVVGKDRVYEEVPSYRSINNEDYKNYQEYYDEVLNDINKAKEVAQIGLYSLENNVTEMTIAYSTRVKSITFVNLFDIFALLSIFFASGLVAKEFSTKTINLLLIRPVRRWKILLSKYICLFTLILGMIGSGVIVYLLGCGIRYGFADLFINHMYVSGGTVHEINFIIWMLGKAFIAAIPIIFLATFTFMISTLSKSSAVSIILGVLAYISSPLSLMLTEFISEKSYARLPFPYITSWANSFTNISTLKPIRSILTNNFMGIEYSYTYGYLLLIALSIIFIVFSFLSFTKRDVK